MSDDSQSPNRALRWLAGGTTLVTAFTLLVAATGGFVGAVKNVQEEVRPLIASLDGLRDGTACRKSFEQAVRFGRPAFQQVGEWKPVSAPSGYYFDPNTIRHDAPTTVHGGGGGVADDFLLRDRTKTTAQVHARILAGSNYTWCEVMVRAELVPINPPPGCSSTTKT